jgi:hypothetical protein
MLRSSSATGTCLTRRDRGDHSVVRTSIAHVRPSSAIAATTAGYEKTPGGNRGFVCARYWDRTSDLFRVREARYRCANRARVGYSVSERWRRDSNPCKRLCRPVPSRSATPPCGLTPRAEGPPKKALALERMTRLELATPTLARLCATNCATSALFPVVVPGTYETLADDRPVSKPVSILARVPRSGHRAS